MEKKYYEQFRIGYDFTDIESPVVSDMNVSINSNEATIGIVQDSDKYLESLVDVIVGVINKINELQLDRKSNYVFIECNGSGALHHVKATLSCKITKKTDRELNAERIIADSAEWRRKHAIAVAAASEKRKATIEAKKQSKLTSAKV